MCNDENENIKNIHSCILLQAKMWLVFRVIINYLSIVGFLNSLSAGQPDQ